MATVTVVVLNLEDLGVAHSAIAGSIIAMETVIAELAKKLPPGLLDFDELVGDSRERIAALRRVSDALLDAELTQ